MSTRIPKESDFFVSYEEARNIVSELDIRSAKDYGARYKESTSPLPANPNSTYHRCWKRNNGWRGFLSHRKTFEYISFDEAIYQNIKSEIAGISDYKARYKHAHPRLPSKPYKIYADEWDSRGRWVGFFGNRRGADYIGLYEAILFNRRDNIVCLDQYLTAARRENSRLPPNPARHYRDYWKSIGGFDGYFSVNKNIKNASYNDASLCAQLMGISNSEEYEEKYKDAPIKLPSSPDTAFKDDWINNGEWNGFLSKKSYIAPSIYAGPKQRVKNIDSSERPQDELESDAGGDGNFSSTPRTKFQSYIAASKIAQSLGIKGALEYQARYRESSTLPSNPSKVWPEEWGKRGGMQGFLGLDTVEFLPLGEASSVVRDAGVISRSRYAELVKTDRRLPSNPAKSYQPEWESFGGWEAYFGLDYYNRFVDFTSAKKIAVDLRIKNSSDYKKRSQGIGGLPSVPRVYYSVEWTGWRDFLMPTSIETFDELRHVVEILNIRNSVDYKMMRKCYSQIPSKPESRFKDDFIDWYDLCRIPRSYPFDELKSMVQSKGLRSINQYNQWRIKLNDIRIVKSPHEHAGYRDVWSNWYDFFGLDVPFKTSNISSEFKKWAMDIEEFAKNALASKEKSTSLCRFVRGYVEPNGWRDPESLLIDPSVNVFEYRRFIQKDVYSPETQRKIHRAVEEFLDWIVIQRLTDEDPDTGELVVPRGVRNRLKNSIGLAIVKQKVNESVKEALCFQYVQELKEWIVAKESRCFSDLKSLHNFNADWKKVPINLIDKSDPDCVYKELSETHALLWIPMDWMHLFAMCSVPLRGIQVAFNDSGEGDEFVPDFDKGAVVWRKNPGPLAGSTNCQGMIKRYADDEFGMFSTSNKTSQRGTASVPWMPLELAYWLIKLRAWQSKYNPLAEPTAWAECRHANLNQAQLKLKGRNCFLFRRMGAMECGTFSNRIHARLAAALYHSQSKNRGLASLLGPDEATLSNYKSSYSPHSMRVSLITMYVNEYDMDLSIVLKIAGHSSIVMTLYYVKTSGATMRAKMEVGEKKALKEKAFHAKSLIENKRIEEIKPSLITTSKGSLDYINNERSVGTYLYKDWGLCPFAGLRCDDGGVMVGRSRVYGPVPAGYVGMQNCVRCRHFVTGPAWVGGLLSLSNEITLALTIEQGNVDSAFSDLESIKADVERENERRYISEDGGFVFDTDYLFRLKLMERQAYSEYERIGLKMDMLYNDLGAASTLIKRCLETINCEAGLTRAQSEKFKIVVQKDSILNVAPEEVSQFHLLCEVCENTEIYQSSTADLAVAPRSQLIDKTLLRNGIEPIMFTLSKRQQLLIGNQLHKLLLSRLKAWDVIDDLVDGKITLADLTFEGRISVGEVKNLLSGAASKPELNADEPKRLIENSEI